MESKSVVICIFNRLHALPIRIGHCLPDARLLLRQLVLLWLDAPPDLNPRLPHYKANALTTRPQQLWTIWTNNNIINHLTYGKTSYDSCKLGGIVFLTLSLHMKRRHSEWNNTFLRSYSCEVKQYRQLNTLQKRIKVLFRRRNCYKRTSILCKN